MHDAVIVSAVRTATGKAPSGTLRGTRPDELAAAVIAEALRRTVGIEAAEVEDVILGCAMPEGEQGHERRAHREPARRCACQRLGRHGESLLLVRPAGDRLRSGTHHDWRVSVIVAGGTESMSMIPMGGLKVSPNPALMNTYPDVYLSTGLVAENHVKEYGISRDDQDAFALRSHQRALDAIDAGRFIEEIVPVAARLFDPATGQTIDTMFGVDEGPRRDTSSAALAKLRPAFHVAGSVTAGNSSQMSDGAAAVVVMSAEMARARGLTPMARFVAYATAGVEPEKFGIGPVPAVRKVLKLAGLTLDQMDVVELNEAFAAQALACLRELQIDPERLNVNGGAIALGHPLGCTGAKLTATALHELRRRNGRYALVTMCVGGGMGAAGIFERM